MRGNDGGWGHIPEGPPRWRRPLCGPGGWTHSEWWVVSLCSLAAANTIASPEGSDPGKGDDRERDQDGGAAPAAYCGAGESIVGRGRRCASGLYQRRHQKSAQRDHSLSWIEECLRTTHHGCGWGPAVRQARWARQCVQEPGAACGRARQDFTRPWCQGTSEGIPEVAPAEAFSRANPCDGGDCGRSRVQGGSPADPPGPPTLHY